MYIRNLLSLMQIKSDNASDNNDDCTSPPVLYVVLLFLDAFDDAFFNDSFKRRMKHNPDFGNGAYGFLSPYCVKHSGFMNKELSDLENGQFIDTFTDLFFFDGASNVQKAGQVLMAMFPRTFCFHGGGTCCLSLLHGYHKN